jgi:hypothetical protein
MEKRRGGVHHAASSVQGQHGERDYAARQYAGSVSDALWPAHLRRSPAASRIAQVRRLLNRSSGAGGSTLYRCGPLLLLTVSSMGIGAALVASLLLRLWPILLLPLLLLALMALVATSPALSRVARAERAPVRPARSVELETPLPSAALVRVLETYDLSTSDVRQFVAPGLERETAELRLNLEREDDEEIVTDAQLL